MVTKKLTLALRSPVLAEWTKGRWYAGRITKLAPKYVRVKCFDGTAKEFGPRSSKVVAVRCTLSFNKHNCGPYGPEHVKVLSALKKPPSTTRNKWVVSEYKVPYRGKFRWEWHVGKLIKIQKAKDKRTPSTCVVAFNNGQVLRRYRPEGVLYISHPAPYVLSGPYEKEDVDQATGDVPRSPLPLPAPKASKPSPKQIPVQPKVGLKVIGMAPGFFQGYYTGIITQVKQDDGIFVISFDNGKTLGAPKAVRWFRPISGQFTGTPLDRPGRT